VARLVVGAGAGGGRPLTPGTVRWLRAMLGSADRERAVDGARAMTAFDSRAWLGRITCPTLVVAGAADTAVPRWHALTLARGIPGAELRFVEGAGHGMIWSHSAEFAALVDDWLRRPDALPQNRPSGG
jgi:3-oxoadipate enol-lactonase